MNIAVTSAKGEKPIEKNVIVVDEAGKEYEATYPKRARGLVKNGRARFVGEHKICLACPPDIKNSEDKIMESINIENSTQKTKLHASETPELPTNITAGYILSKIEQIQAEFELFYSKTSGESISAMGDSGLSELNDIIKCRETTNQKLIEFYKNVYNDIKPISKSDSLKWIKECIAVVEPGVELPNFAEIINQLNSF